MNTDKRRIVRRDIVKQIGIILKPWLHDIENSVQIHEGLNLLTDLGIDSVAILQLILESEKRFNITIKEHELDSKIFSRMGYLIDIIEGKINEID